MFPAILSLARSVHCCFLFNWPVLFPFFFSHIAHRTMHNTVSAISFVSYISCSQHALRRTHTYKKPFFHLQTIIIKNNLHLLFFFIVCSLLLFSTSNGIFVYLFADFCSFVCLMCCATALQLQTLFLFAILVLYENAAVCTQLRWNVYFGLSLYLGVCATEVCKHCMKNVFINKKNDRKLNIIHFASFECVHTYRHMKRSSSQPLHIVKNSIADAPCNSSTFRFIFNGMQQCSAIFNGIMPCHSLSLSVCLFLSPSAVFFRLHSVEKKSFFSFSRLLIHFYFYSFDICYWYKCFMPQPIYKYTYKTANQMK